MFMFKILLRLRWVASLTLLMLNTHAAALAQTATFFGINDALSGRCYNSATTALDPLNPNQLNIGIHSGTSAQTWQTAACVASDNGPVSTMDTISFLVNAPTGYYITRITFTQLGSTSGSRGGAGFRGASWVVDDDALIIPSTATGWAATVDLTGQDKTIVPVAITTFLAAGGGTVRSGSATATHPQVIVELAPSVGPPPPPPPPSNPVPTTTSISPMEATAGSSGFTLTVTGNNFVTGVVVLWNSTNRATTAVSGTQLRATITAADVASAGTATVAVLNPTPGGGLSNGQLFTIHPAPPPHPVPTTTAISPTAETAGRSGFTLTVSGSNFINSSVVRWGGANRTTTFVSATQLTATITAGDIAFAGPVAVTVFTPAAGFNPPPDGGVSNEQTFTVNPIPPPPGPLPVVAHGNVDDLRGKEWRQLTQTSGLTWSQVAQICPQDGVTPCSGKIGTINFTDWVWANSTQVRELLSYFAPDILTNATVAGPNYVTTATQFQNLFQLTQHITGTVNYQFFNFRFVGGVTATASFAANGTPLPVGGAVTIAEEMFGPTASFSLDAITPGETTVRGVFLWRPTGLGTGSVHANNDEGQSPSPLGGNAFNVLSNDWIAGTQATAANAAVTLASAVAPPTPTITLTPQGWVNVAAGTATGTYTLSYHLCAVSNPANCDTAQVAVTIRSFPLVAANDQAFASYGAGGTALANVLANDTLGGLAASLSIVSLRQVSTSNSGINLNAGSGAVIVAAGTSSGVHTLVYEACEIANPSNCKSATVTLLAKSIDAVNDVFPKLSSKDGGVSPSVLANDRFNGSATTSANVQLSLLTSLPVGITFSLSTGVFTVAPDTESGDYPVTYRICELVSLTNCDSASLILELSGSADD